MTYIAEARRIPTKRAAVERAATRACRCSWRRRRITETRMSTAALSGAPAVSWRAYHFCRLIITSRTLSGAHPCLHPHAPSQSTKPSTTLVRHDFSHRNAEKLRLCAAAVPRSVHFEYPSRFLKSGLGTHCFGIQALQRCPNPACERVAPSRLASGSQRADSPSSCQVRRTGFGRFQGALLFYTGLAWAADAMEMMLLSFLGPAVRCSWNLSATQVSDQPAGVGPGMVLQRACMEGHALQAWAAAHR